MRSGNGVSGRSRVEGRRYRITGRVQGVGFRWWTAKLAEAMDLGGWVRNLPDGVVEVEAWGDPSALDRLEAELRRGPRHARVEDVVRGPVPEGTPGPRRFSILG